MACIPRSNQPAGTTGQRGATAKLNAAGPLGFPRLSQSLDEGLVSSQGRTEAAAKILFGPCDNQKSASEQLAACSTDGGATETRFRRVCSLCLVHHAPFELRYVSHLLHYLSVGCRLVKISRIRRAQSARLRTCSGLTGFTGCTHLIQRG